MNNFDALRLLGSLLVILSHQATAQGRQDLDFAEGGVGVAMFFGMSGYLVCKSWRNDPNILRFGARRLLRIWPALIVLVWITSTIAGSGFFQSRGLDALMEKIAAEAYLSNLFFLNFDWPGFFGMNPHGGLNPSLWTIPYEASCYAAVAVLGVLCLIPKPLALVVVVAVLVFVHEGVDLERIQFWLTFGSMFAVGAVMQLMPRTGLVLGVLGGFVMPSLWWSALAVWVGQQSWPGLREVGRFGDYSYGLYLWGWPVTQVGVMVYGPGHWWLVFWTLAYAGVCAWISWHLIEKQALRMKPSVH